MEYYGFNWIARDGEEVSVVLNLVTPNQSAEEHRHDFYEVTYILSGTGFHVIDGVNYSVQRGDLVFLNPRIVHQVYTRDYITDGGQLTYVDLYMSRDFVERALQDYPAARQILQDLVYTTQDGQTVPVVPVIHLSGRKQDMFASLFAYMYEEELQREYNYQNILRRFSMMVIDEIVRDVTRRNGLTIHSIGSITKETVQYIENHFRERIKLSDVAAMSYMQPSYFCKQFKKYYKMTFVHYIHKRRIETAVELLKRGNVHSIGDLIEYLGYQERQQFYRYFRMYTGMTPSQLQRTLREPDGKNNAYPQDKELPKK